MSYKSLKSIIIKSPIRNILFLIGIILSYLFFHNYIKFNCELFNDLTKFALTIIPTIFLFINSFIFKKKIYKILSIVIFSVPLLVSVLSVPFFFILLGQDIFCKPIVILYSIPMGNTKVNIYRQDRGPTEPFEILVNHEMKIFPGISIYKRIYYIAHIDDIYYEVDGENDLILKDIEYVDVGEEKLSKKVSNRVHEFKLKKHVFY